VDGVRVNDVDDGTVSLSAIPLSAIERIEIRRAGGGVLFGDRALGGVINIITKPEKKNKAEVNSSVGSFGLKAAGASLSRLVGSGSVHLDIQRANLDGYRRQSWQAQTSVLTRILMPTKVGELGIMLRGSDEDLKLPASITLATFDTDPRSPGNYRTDSKRNSRSGILSLETQFDPTLRTNINVLVESLKRLSTSDYGYLLIPENIIYETSRKSISLDANKQFNSTLVLFGAEFFNAESESNRLNRNMVTQTSKAGYLSLEQTIKNSKLMAGIRTQEMKNEFLPTPTSAGQKSSKRLTSWSLAAKHPIWGGVLRSGLQSSFAFPNADQLYTFDSTPPFLPKDIYPGVDPMKSEELQIGWLKQSAENAVEFSARRVLIKDEIGYKPNCVDKDACNDNLYDTSRSIFTARYEKNLTNDTRFSVSLDVINAEIQSGTSAGKRVPMTPKQALKTTISHRIMGGNAYLIGHYRDQMYAFGDNSNSGQQIPSRTLVDIGWSSFFVSALEIQIWIRNLFDKQYYDFAAYGSVAPGDGRSFELSARYRF
jgi:iron complex outermembrane receptor protein